MDLLNGVTVNFEEEWQTRYIKADLNYKCTEDNQYWPFHICLLADKDRLVMVSITTPIICMMSMLTQHYL